MIHLSNHVPSIVPDLSPKYDDVYMNCKIDSIFDVIKYISNVCSYISSSHFSNLLHAIPMISMIPSLETSSSPDSDGFMYASHICSGMEMVQTLRTHEEKRICFDDYDDLDDVWNDMFGKEKIIVDKESGNVIVTREKMLYYNIITGEEIQIFKKCLKNGPLCWVSRQTNSYLMDEEEKDGKDSPFFTCHPCHPRRVKHSSLIQYTPPQHLLVQMSFDEERSLRQSVYDLIEQTGCGVEALFDDRVPCCSFEGYDQDAWRETMEDIHDEEEEEYEEEDSFRSEEDPSDWL
ncbi:hypothetical protein ADUPG1_008953 [Aduncisulcus paluster]|uniref:Uncharacterized protein n=1 Tax=Aduncisulcus paluster TaxID=2918883 RepID=A0ABQ5KTT7_9EUKA|nr:hypothetical protein ADUPG1_008953 [Aduncisulcus paluster]